MDHQLKQRLVGIAVIFSLAVIFLPMLLSGPTEESGYVDFTIPVPPKITPKANIEEKIIELKNETEDLVKLEPVYVDELTESLDEKPAVETKAPAENKKIETSKKAEAVEKKVKAPEVEQTDTEKVGGSSWVIQVASFAKKGKALRQRDIIRKSKLGAVFIENFEYQGGIRYRVRVGPFLKRAKAEVIKNKVLAKHNLKGLVMKYEK